MPTKKAAKGQLVSFLWIDRRQPELVKLYGRLENLLEKRAKLRAGLKLWNRPAVLLFAAVSVTASFALLNRSDVPFETLTFLLMVAMYYALLPMRIRHNKSRSRRTVRRINSGKYGMAMWPRTEEWVALDEALKEHCCNLGFLISSHNAKITPRLTEYLERTLTSRLALLANGLTVDQRDRILPTLRRSAEEAAADIAALPGVPKCI